MDLSSALLWLLKCWPSCICYCVIAGVCCSAYYDNITRTWWYHCPAYTISNNRSAQCNSNGPRPSVSGWVDVLWHIVSFYLSNRLLYGLNGETRAQIPLDLQVKVRESGSEQKCIFSLTFPKKIAFADAPVTADVLEIEWESFFTSHLGLLACIFVTPCGSGRECVFCHVDYKQEGPSICAKCNVTWPR